MKRFLQLFLPILLFSTSCFNIKYAKAQALQDISGNATISVSGASGNPNVLKDNDPNTVFGGASSNTPMTFTYDLGSQKVLQGYSISPHPFSAPAYTPKIWKLEGSNNNSTWTSIDNRSGMTWDANPDRKLFNAGTNTTAYRYYRFVVNRNNVGGFPSYNVEIAEIELFENFSINGRIFLDANYTDGENYNPGAGDQLIENATVYLKQLSSSAAKATTTTDNNGYYSFSRTDLDNLSVFAVVVNPPAGMQIVSERNVQGGVSFPRTTYDGSYIFHPHNKDGNTYPTYTRDAQNLDFGFRYATGTIPQNMVSNNLITNEQNGTFGTTDTNKYLANHPNARTFNRNTSHPELYRAVNGYAIPGRQTIGSWPFPQSFVGHDFTGNGNINNEGILWEERSYVVTDFLGTLVTERGDEARNLLNDHILGQKQGWRSSFGATTGEWNDQFLAVNGSNNEGNSTTNLLFTDQFELVSGREYTVGFYGKNANKFIQGSNALKEVTVQYQLVNLSNSNVVKTGLLTLPPSNGDESDRPHNSWVNLNATYTPTATGNYAIYYYLGTGAVVGNDFYLDNFYVSRNQFSISGKVFNDSNGLVNNMVDGNPINDIDGALYAYLIDPTTGKVTHRQPVSASGEYAFNDVTFKTYQVAISNKQIAINGDYSYDNNNMNDIEDGDAYKWKFMGVHYGQNNLSGTGNINSHHLIEVIPGNAVNDVTNVNFGYNRLPFADEKTYVLPHQAFTEGAPTGYPDLSSPTERYFYIPTSDENLSGYTHNGLLTGSDPEDCPDSESCNLGTTFKVNSIYPSTVLFYNYGGETGVRALQVGDSIPNYDPALLMIYAKEGTGMGDTTGGVLSGNPVGFEYSIVDAAGFWSAPAPYTILTDNALPVELLYFTAQAQGCDVVLEWATASEMNNDFFEIQRSSNSYEWNTIGKVDGNGNCNTRVDYQFVDNDISNGINYYRLKQVDFDGTAEYHKIISVDGTKCSTATVKIFPVPAQNILNVNLSFKDLQKAQLTIIDVSGKRIRTISQVDANNQIDLSNIPNGTYFLQINSNNKQVETYPFSIVK
ncbi:MAG TPA: T9SS type A sorting domain-containing protein [Chitinophagales bacterium]|nr:T9SS type A sorting domain-containing protein [Chitinophagales bacterium]